MTVLLGYWGGGASNQTTFEETCRRLGLQKPAVSLEPEFGLAWKGPGLFRAAGKGYLFLAGKSSGLLASPDTADPASLLAALQTDESGSQYALVGLAGPGGPLSLAHDPFGAVRVYYTRSGGTLWFSTDLKVLLGLPALRRHRSLNLSGLHTYLAFSFVAAPHTLIEQVQVVPPNQLLSFDGPQAGPVSRRLFEPPAPLEGLSQEREWLERLQTELEGAMRRSMSVEGPVAVHLSGGLDSSAVAAYLARRNINTRAFHLDFEPPYDAERPFARQTAHYLGLELTTVPVTPGPDGARWLRRLVWRLGEPWGDPVTLPLLRGFEAVRQAGLEVVFNGEGGDQLFAGWPNRPMLAASLYGPAGNPEHTSLARTYLQTFHHFYGLEGALYGPGLQTTSRANDLAALVEPYLHEPGLPALFDRLRWANYWLKGSQNIMPRVAALGRSYNLDMRAPFFDRRLARFALQIPFEFLMRGTGEKYLLKQALARGDFLPAEVLERPKRGMGVPATEWCRGPLRKEFEGLLHRLARRGLFSRSYLKMLARGEDLPNEIRRQRRLGEKIWQLGVLEIWLELFYDDVILREP